VEKIEPVSLLPESVNRSSKQRPGPCLTGPFPRSDIFPFLGAQQDAKRAHNVQGGDRTLACGSETLSFDAQD